jgi:hypothetical protein
MGQNIFRFVSFGGNNFDILGKICDLPPAHLIKGFALTRVFGKSRRSPFGVQKFLVVQLFLCACKLGSITWDILFQGFPSEIELTLFLSKSSGGTLRAFASA